MTRRPRSTRAERGAARTTRPVARRLKAGLWLLFAVLVVLATSYGVPHASSAASTSSAPAAVSLPSASAAVPAVPSASGALADTPSPVRYLAGGTTTTTSAKKITTTYTCAKGTPDGNLCLLTAMPNVAHSSCGIQNGTWSGNQCWNTTAATVVKTAAGGTPPVPKTPPTSGVASDGVAYYCPLGELWVGTQCYSPTGADHVSCDSSGTWYKGACYSTAPASTTPLITDNGTLQTPTPPAGCSLIGPLPATYTTCSPQSDINKLLPLNRWNSAATDMTVGPVGANPLASSVTDALSAIATVMFSMSSFVWTLIFDVMQFALTHDLVTGAGKVINQGFRAFSQAILGSGLVVVLIFVTILTLALALLRGNSKVKIVNTILAMVIPIAAIQALSTLAGTGAAVPATATTAAIPATGVVAQGSPAWLATEGLLMADAISSGIADSVTKVMPTLGSQLGNDASQLPPGCSAYVETLYSDYATAQAAVASDPKNGMSTTGTTTLAAISALWESGYLVNWINAEFSSGPDGANLFCHYLDATNAAGISQYEQRAINAQAYGTTLGSKLPTLSIDPSNINPYQDAVLFGYAACYYQGGSWQLRPSWSALSKPDHWNGDGTWCSAWATKVGAYGAGTNTANGFGALIWTKNGALENDYSNSPNQAVAVTAFNTANTYGGNGAGASRILAALISLLTALAYGWALLGIGIGSIVAQLGLIVMLILLPATLFMLALPRKKGKDGAVSHNLGTKLLRMTAGFFACRLIVTVVLVVLVYLTLTLSSIASPSSYTGSPSSPTTTTSQSPSHP